MIKTNIRASRKQPEGSSHIEIIINAKSDNDGNVMAVEIEKAVRSLNRKMDKKLSYEIVSVIRNNF